MRRLLAVLGFSLLAALSVPTMALATHSNGPGPNKDFLSGAAKGPIAGTCPSSPGHFHTNGQSTDAVTNAGTGNFWVTIDLTNCPGGSLFGFTTAEFSGHVICVNAYLGPAGEENSVIWRGVIDEVLLNPGGVPGIPGLLFAGDTIRSRHVDKGEPGAGSDRALGFREGPGLTTCPAANFTTFPITQGNLIVHDGI
jgi:hypothetical protein